MRFLITVFLVLGICFRFANLDHKIYWYDETFTSLRASGYTEAEIVQHFAESPIASVADLQQYQQPAPDRGIAATIHSLAVEDTQHPPLYYVLANLWFRSMGSSVIAARLLPALMSLLAFPSMYWLCQELFVKTGVFSSNLPAWIGVGLLAMSPFQVLYAQESRQYSLWSATTVLTTAALLRAMRSNSRWSWGIYAITLAINLYTFLLSGLVAVAHGVYVLTLSKFRLDRRFLAYLGASLLGLLAFTPWILTLLANLSQAHTVTSWTGTQRSVLTLPLSWLSMLGRLFYDRGVGLSDRLVQSAIVGLVCYAFYCLCRQTPKPVWLLVVTLTGVPALALILPDVVLGGLRSTFPRYLIPSLLGVQIAVTYLLAAKLLPGNSSSGSLSPERLLATKPAILQPQAVQPQPISVQNQWRWNGIAVAIFLAGVLSCATIAPTSVWWIKTLSKENLAVAEIINQTPNAVLVSDAETADLLSLSYLLDSDIKLLIYPRCYTCDSHSGEELYQNLLQFIPTFNEAFLFHPRASKRWRQSLQEHPPYGIAPVTKEDKVLWRIVNK